MKLGSAVYVVLIGVIAALSLALIIPAYHELEGTKLREASRNLVGRSETEIVQLLGQPLERMAFSNYVKEHRRIASTFEPDPPMLTFDVALQYIQGTRLVLVFVKDGVAIHVYDGLT